MEILTGEEMRRVDRRAIEALGLASLLLMESAGRGIAEALLDDYPDLEGRAVLVLCGGGNNGGDGLVAARHLARLGVVPRVLLFASASDLKGDPAVNLRAAVASGIAVEEIPDEPAWEKARATFPTSSRVVVLDALLGTGIRGGPHGLLAQVIEDINRSGRQVVALDLPSGLDASSSAVEGPAVRATRSYTLCRPKLALLLDPAASLAGLVRVIPIGIPDQAVADERPSLEQLDREAARGLIPARAVASHKGTFGHLLIVAGSRGKSGAAVLVARGALRSGVGLVTVATPVSAQALVAAQQAEVMTEPLAETAEGSLGTQAVPRVVELLGTRDALALGPGLGEEPETRRAVLKLLACLGGAAVIDADGLNALAASGRDSLSILRRSEGKTVLTPHPGEAARLLEASVAAVQADRLAAARSLARSSRAVVVLKGHRTVIARPDGMAAINVTGNPGMATGGTGDVLTGMVGSYLARGLAPYDAARLAVFLHGSAGDRAAAICGEESMIAGDLLDHLPEAIAALALPRGSRRW